MTADRNSPAAMKKIKRTLCFIAAAIFLLEAWLWDNLWPIVARLIALLPWKDIKLWIADKIQHFPAWACVLLFAIPAIAIFPIKLLGVWLISRDHIFFGIIVFAMAKLVGLGVAGFLFETTREKLLSIGWVLWLYETILKIRKWAAIQVAPAVKEIKRIKLIITSKRSRLITLLKKIRKNALYRIEK